MIFMKQKRCCVVTLQIANRIPVLEKIGKISIPTFVRYAHQIKADFHVIQRREFTDPEDGWAQTVWEKFQIGRLLDIYDKILYVDLDCYITKNCENVFETYANADFVGMTTPIPSGSFYLDYLKMMNQSKGADGNSGVLIIDKKVKPYFCLAPNWKEQALQNVLSEQLWIFSNLFWNNVPVTNIAPHLHQMKDFKPEGIFHALLAKDTKLKLLKSFQESDY